MKSLVRDALWHVWAPLANRAARGYVAGPTFDDARRACGGLFRQGYRATLGHWCPRDATPREVAEEYATLLTAMPPAASHWQISVKAPELDFSLDLASTTADAARRARVRMHFDSHGPETAERTLMLISRILPRHPDVGYTLPGRWTRSLKDADRAVEMGLAVRVVKGQWSDPDEQAVDPREGFLRVVEQLAGRARHVAVASHDPLTARPALLRLHASGTPCELELLYGLPMQAALDVARETQTPIRVYVPYGRGWLPYCFTQMGRNPRIGWWLMRDMASRHPGTGAAMPNAS